MRILILTAVTLALAACVDGVKMKAANLGSDYGGFGGHKTAATNATLLSAEQMVRSMSSVSQVPLSSGIINEYNSRKTLMTDDYTVNSVTSPMMVSITNLASRFCEAVVNKEAGLTAAQRRFFSQVDFSKPVSALSESQYADVLDKLGRNILGRRPTEDEKRILSEARAEFEAAIPAANKTQAAQTRLLMLFSCSGVMSSFDFITI